MKAASFAVTSIPTLVKTQELGVATREQIRVVLDAALSALRAVRRDDLVATNDALTDFSSSILALKGIPTGV